MKRMAIACVAALFSCAVAATAETQQPGEPQQNETQQRENTTGDQSGQRQTPSTPSSQPQLRSAMSSFIGCVERGSAPNAFVLTVVETPGARPQGQAQARAGQSAAQATGTSGAMVGHKMELIGGTNMASHVGHKVEVTGMIVPQGSATGRPGQSASDMRVNVSNVRMIETTCMPPSATSGTAGSADAPRTTTPQPSPVPEKAK